MRSLNINFLSNPFFLTILIIVNTFLISCGGEIEIDNSDSFLEEETNQQNLEFDTDDAQATYDTENEMRFLTSSIPNTLRGYAERQNIMIGTAVGGGIIRSTNASSTAYKNMVKTHFNSITPANDMKFDPIHPNAPGSNNEYEWQKAALDGKTSKADAAVQFAYENGMKVRGHTLMWHSQLCDDGSTNCWVYKKSKAELCGTSDKPGILEKHIKAVIGRYRTGAKNQYKGVIKYWDVINEVLDYDNTKNANYTGIFSTIRNDNLWINKCGLSIIEKAFHWAHEADPDAKLFYNEIFAEGLGSSPYVPNDKSESLYKLVAYWKNRGVPIHGVAATKNLG